MGFSNLFAAGLVFSVLVGIFYVLNERLPEDVVDLQTELAQKYEDLSSDARTSFIVRSLTYYSDDALLACILENTGGEILDPDGVSLLVGGTYVDESILNVTRSLLDDTINPGLWDQEQLFQLNATIGLAEGTHQVKCFYVNGASASGEITVTNSSMSWTVTDSDQVEGDVATSCEIIEIGATEDDDYVYLRINVTGEISSNCVYNFYLDIDGDKDTGLPAEDKRRVLEYPGGGTKKRDVGIESLITYRDGQAALYSVGDLNVLEEDGTLFSVQPSSSSLIIRMEPSDLGYLPSESVSFDFYTYTIDELQRVDYCPNP